MGAVRRCREKTEDVIPQNNLAPIELIGRLRSQVDSAFRPLLADAQAVALVDFPVGANVGDSVIWTAEMAYLRDLGLDKVRYVCETTTYSYETMARKIGSGVIILSGGGNLGDLWTGIQEFRERVIRDFPHNRIIQAPQSIHFQSPKALATARDVFNGHSDFTLLVRDQQSLDLAKNEFRGPSILCPDVAFWLGPLSRSQPASRDVVWLSRTDQESVSSNKPPAAFESTDWRTEG